jgi:phytoene dehydrogenase-like protein
MNGYATHIFEKESRPGGVCTSWRRGEYVFDGCIEWLVGTRPGSFTNRIWQSGDDVFEHLVDWLRVPLASSWRRRFGELLQFSNECL